MSQITEDYVSFETAKLLKKKGFDEPCHALYYNGEDKIFFSLDVDSYHNSILNVDCYACPTLQMTVKWLREVHNIFIAINMIPDTIQKPYFFKPYVDKKIYNFPLDYSVEFYTTYEEACEAAIKYCLENLI